MPDLQFISLTVAAASRNGSPVIDVIGTDLRIWPTGHNGALISMSSSDWDVLVASVEAARENAKAVA